MPAKRQSELNKIWQMIWPYILAITGFTVGAFLIYLNLAYKHGWISDDWGGYISSAIAVIGSLGLFIWYIKKTIKIIRLSAKLKNRH